MENSKFVQNRDIFLVRKLSMFAIVVYLLYLGFTMYAPVMTAIMLAIILAIILTPLAELMAIKMPRLGKVPISLIIVGTIFMAFMAVPSFIGYKTVDSYSSFVSIFTDKDNRTEIVLHYEKAVDKLLEKNEGLKTLYDKHIADSLSSDGNIETKAIAGIGIGKFIKIGLTTVGKLLKSLVGTLLLSSGQILLSLCILFLILCNWKFFIKRLFLLIPVRYEVREEFIESIITSVQAISKGMFWNGVFQGGAGALFFIPYLYFYSSISPWYYILIFLGFFITSVFSAPTSAGVLFICSLIELSNGQYLLAGGLGFGTWVAMIADNPAKKIMGDSLDMNFLVMVMAIGCGMAMFGMLGFMIGPVVTKLCFRILDSYFDILEKHDDEYKTHHGKERLIAGEEVRIEKGYDIEDGVVSAN